MRERLDSLDGWRAISVLWVVAVHVQKYSSVRFALPLGHVDYGPLGVEFFFGISGFVIARGFLKAGEVNLRGFYVRRFFRIIPPLAAYILAVCLLAQFRIVDGEGTKTVRALAFSCDFINSDCGGWFGAHTWSLSAEEQFYLVVPILFVLVKQRWLLTSFVCSLGTVALVLYALRWGDAAYVAIKFVTIGLGVGAALNEAKVREWAERSPTWLVALALVVIVAIWSIPLDKALIFRVPRSALANVARILILDPLVVFVLMATTFKPSPLRAVLASWPLRTFGVVSYSFYLWQQLATAPWPGATVWFYAASILLCGAFSFASYRWFESPLIAVGGWLARRLSRKGVTAPLAGGPATTATSAPVASSPNGVDGR